MLIYFSFVYFPQYIYVLYVQENINSDNYFVLLFILPIFYSLYLFFVFCFHFSPII